MTGGRRKGRRWGYGIKEKYRKGASEKKDGRSGRNKHLRGKE